MDEPFIVQYIHTLNKLLDIADSDLKLFVLFQFIFGNAIKSLSEVFITEFKK